MIQTTSGLIFIVGLSLITVSIVGILVTYAIDLYEEKKYGKLADTDERSDESVDEVADDVAGEVAGEKKEENGGDG